VLIHALTAGWIDEKTFDEVVDPKKMVFPPWLRSSICLDLPMPNGLIQSPYPRVSILV
jgi:hypothetical protein